MVRVFCEKYTVFGEQSYAFTSLTLRLGYDCNSLKINRAITGKHSLELQGAAVLSGWVERRSMSTREEAIGNWKRQEAIHVVQTFDVKLTHKRSTKA